MKKWDELINGASMVLAKKSMETPVIVRKFRAEGAKHAEIALSSFGFFRLYINGKRVGDEYFLPSNSIYCKRNFESLTYPIKDEFTYRCYYTRYDILPYLNDGDNLLEIMLGNGWYRQTERVAEGDMSFGDALGAIYAIELSDIGGARVIQSDGSELCRDSHVLYSNLFHGEVIDCTKEGKADHTYQRVEKVSTDTAFCDEISPPDREIRRISPKCIGESNGKRIYDAGENVSGFAVVIPSGAAGERITVRYAEKISGSELDFLSTGSNYISKSGKAQIMEDSFISSGGGELEPYFVWHAFRYFEVEGGHSDVYVKVIHSDCRVSGRFNSSSAELNWLYDAFVRTQLDNMHGGVPSDCPHRERLGYTGDGQVCAPASMMLLDSKSFYDKWLCDIFDSQDKVSGHVNHTAPFAGGGGGPGGWGMAAITVPYNYYKIFDDISPAKKYYPLMKRWVKYLIRHSECGLLTHEEEGGWCLGDWCTLGQTVIPEEYVNTCLFVRALGFMRELADKLGEHIDTEMFENIADEAKRALVGKYFDESTGSFAGGIQGADAYALCIGLGDERTLENLKNKYDKLGHFDTGFLGTDILCEVLFANSAENIAYKLISSHDIGGYGYMMDIGATTLYESWQGDGSGCHPMFGAPARMLISAILGISRDTAGGCLVAPRIPDGLEYAEGYTEIDGERLSVAWKKENGDIIFDISVPENIKCEFSYKGTSLALGQKSNKFKVRI